DRAGGICRHRDVRREPGDVRMVAHRHLERASAAPGDDDLRTLLCEAECRGAADPRASAGDDGDLVLQSFHDSAPPYCGSSMVRVVSSVLSTNTASSLAGSVSLAFALTLWWSPGSSAKLSPAWYTVTGPSLTWLRIAPSRTVA